MNGHRAHRGARRERASRSALPHARRRRCVLRTARIAGEDHRGMPPPETARLPPISPPWVGRVFVAAIGLVGAVPLAVAVDLFADDRARATSWRHTVGTVVDIAGGTTA